MHDAQNLCPQLVSTGQLGGSSRHIEQTEAFAAASPLSGTPVLVTPAIPD